MTNLDDLKLVIPDWRTLFLQFHQHKTKYGIRVGETYKIPEIEAKRFVARLVLLQIAKHVTGISDINIDQFVENIELSSGEDFVILHNWLNKNNPEILEWYFA